MRFHVHYGRATVLPPLVNAILRGLVEGITEFLPISSTGHLILVEGLLPLSHDSEHAQRLNSLFNLVVQFPAILAVVLLYRQRLRAAAVAVPRDPGARRFALGVALAFMPIAIAGLLLKERIEAHLMHPVPVALALIAGGVVLLFIERVFAEAKIVRAEDVGPWRALGIGLFQCLALFPGTSRSAATIIGGRLLGLDRNAAAEYSFFLAIPVLGAAGGYKLLRDAHLIQWQTDLPLLLAGSAAAFISAWLVVAAFIRYLEHHSLAAFGVYRIVLGVIVLLATLR